MPHGFNFFHYLDFSYYWFLLKFYLYMRFSLTLLMFTFFVPNPLVGEGTIYSNGFFCSINFGRSIYSSWRNMSSIIKKLIQRRIRNLKNFLNFVFFQELSRFELSCEHLIFGSLFVQFYRNFRWITIFSMIIFILNYISSRKTNHFSDPNWRKAIKRLVLVS